MFWESASQIQLSGVEIINNKVLYKIVRTLMFSWVLWFNRKQSVEICFVNASQDVQLGINFRSFRMICWKLETHNSQFVCILYVVGEFF
jgi:hypothetical protein